MFLVFQVSQKNHKYTLVSMNCFPANRKGCITTGCIYNHPGMNQFLYSWMCIFSSQRIAPMESQPFEQWKKLMSKGTWWSCFSYLHYQPQHHAAMIAHSVHNGTGHESADQVGWVPGACLPSPGTRKLIQTCFVYGCDRGTRQAAQLSHQFSSCHLHHVS